MGQTKSCARAYLRAPESFSYAPPVYGRPSCLTHTPQMFLSSWNNFQRTEGHQRSILLPLGMPAWLLLSFLCTGFGLMLVVNTLSPSFVKNLIPLSTFNIISDTQGQSSSKILNRKFQKQLNHFKLCLLESILVKLISFQLIL